MSSKKLFSVNVTI